MTTLDLFLKSERAYMYSELTHIVTSIRPVLADMKNDLAPDDNETLTIDIRLCIDRADSEAGYTWVFRTGDSSYDHRHSEWCGASSISLDTNVKDLLNDLISQLE